MKANPLKLKILVNNEKTEQQKLIGLEPTDEMYDVDELYVYTIDAVRPYRLGGNNYSIIASGGIEYTTVYSVALMLEKIGYWK